MLELDHRPWEGAPGGLPADFGDTPLSGLRLPDGSRDLLLHCCCAPCSGAVLEALVSNGLRPIAYFGNPNIQPDAEWRRRRDELLAFAARLGVQCVVDTTPHSEWRRLIAGMEGAPERGRRCLACFTLRLRAAARFAAALGLPYLATTLATSRWKSKPQVDMAGRAATATVRGVEYWDQDWRKQGMAERRNCLVRAIGFYNQEYCGCEFSSRYPRQAP
ncbi:MAG: epoxyqueuosine reductase QueH [Succinivibrionaceae bacterium]|nr:epoxyqueuosine reductase QueH [Succinivibrionaceae bacterium]